MAEELSELEKENHHEDGDIGEIYGHRFYYYKGRFQVLSVIEKELGIPHATLHKWIWKGRTFIDWTGRQTDRKPAGTEPEVQKSAAEGHPHGHCIHHQGDFHNCFSCPYADCIEYGALRGEPNLNRLHLNGHDVDDPFCRPKKVTAALGSFGDYGNFLW